MAPHPFRTLNLEETRIAKQVILASHPDVVVDFREIFLQEPAKELMKEYLALEHSSTPGQSPTSKRPPRLAKCQYDVIGSDKIPEYHESIVDVETSTQVKHEVIGKDTQASLTMWEFDTLIEACQRSEEFQKAISEFKFPDGFELVIEPWPYGGLDLGSENRRYFQGLCFAQDTRNKNADSNFYAYPLPLIPVLDAHKKEIVRIDRLATGGKGDSLTGQTHSERVLDHCQSAEYVPELLPGGTRKDMKPINITQPEGTSFTVTDESLVEWQKWRFRVSFNPREGAVLHDVHYDGRSVLYRLSISEMTVPYGDPRPPFHRKQAFDFGDGGAGNCANNLSLGCDCLGVIKYFDGVVVGSNGEPKVHPNVICLHEQDNGIGWKHTNWRTGRAVVTRMRELVIQFIITLANYEYVFSYHLDTAGGITLEVRATGIVSVVNIDPGKTSEYGNVVSGGVLAQNHQHIFAARIDPAIDGHKNTVLHEESHTAPWDPATNPNGNFYEIRKTVVERSAGLDAAPEHNRVFKIINPSKLNPLSGNPVGYKFMPPPTQKLLASKGSLQANRALFTEHHVWVTKYRDDELYAAGRFTLQSQHERGGVYDMAKRNDAVVDEDLVVWSVFGLTHNPRVEDWPVMPCDIFQVHFKPSDFFTANPAIDVPSTKNNASVLAGKECCVEKL
ncbi:copper amine oxidase-like protein [Aaosphaeria arxii CBS 175.79]|uniref:Amine oxidase n=1 Tax=Aaosphaeria arxii CBS 175.79 TaxID=1450172 RepID=A0A6A5XHU4_9PLEO|nr:copper amine oxidase-like protein [Aaosphaeria arxii CBS 175.79]KAF2012523.1 copper amine oxidase-like protein [Aaosphaeria arxii CBS 175.79]